MNLRQQVLSSSSLNNSGFDYYLSIKKISFYKELKQREEYTMNKMTLSAMMLFAFGLLLFGAGNSYSQEFPQGTVIMFGQPTISGWDTLEASSMVLGQLTTDSGDYLGQISDLVIDPESGHISEVVISDIQGIGSEQVSVPFTAVSHRGNNVFVFDEPQEYRWRFSSGGEPFFHEPYPQWAEIQLTRSVLPMPAGAYHFSTLRGVPVQTPKGEQVGRVNDLVIDLAKSQVVYLVLSDVGEKEGKMVVVPFNELSKESGNVFTLHVTKDKVVNSPAFTSSAVSNRGYAENVYRYYGVQPYWSEE